MIIHNVTSGSYMIGRKKQESLQAFLGSCVGVALFDRKAGIGGLIHLLLPEPPSMDRDWNPGVCAATGMPIFIEELYRQGAGKGRLQACIAGGALIDPLSQADLTLDLGGRTADVVQQILHDSNIPILQIEVGGYFSCCIRLNLSTWETTIEPHAIPAPQTTVKHCAPLEAPELDETIEKLIPIPQTALKIIRMINDDTVSFREVSEEILHDQVLSARIIRMCNSVCISPGKKVDSIEKALMRIGEKSLVLMALSFSVEKFIIQATRGYSLCKGGLFYHSVWAARIAGHLAELTGKALPDLAYTAGLLHDIGKVVLDQYMHDAYPLFYRQLQIEGNDLAAAEKTLFGIAHTDAGYLLACRWRMPEFVSNTVLYHHEPHKAGSGLPLPHLVYIADLLSSRFVLGHQLSQVDSSHLRSSLNALGLDTGAFSALLADASFPAFDVTCC